MSNQTPSPGRIVHYVLPDGPNEGATRPAMIVAESDQGNLVTLDIFAIRSEDGPAYECGIVQRLDVEQGTEPGTWAWPTITVNTPDADTPKHSKKEAKQ